MEAVDRVQRDALRPRLTSVSSSRPLTFAAQASLVPIAGRNVRGCRHANTAACWADAAI